MPSFARSSSRGCAAALLLAASALLPAWAASSAASSVSDSISTSVGSISDSIKKSSKSSSGDDKVAAGDYQIIDMAALPERPGYLRVTLQAAATPGDAGTVVLHLPQAAIDAGHLATGQTITASDRPYGTAFARADQGQAFFLVLADDWFRQLQTTPVTL